MIDNISIVKQYIFDEEKHLFKCSNCGVEWSTFPHHAKKNSICGQCRKENSMKPIIANKVEMTEKQQFVVNCLNQNLDMPTKEIIKSYSSHWGGSKISARHVQRIRKWYKENMLKEGDKKMHLPNSMLEWEIDLLNMVNEGGWSIQQLAQHFEKEDDDIKSSLTNHKFMLLHGTQIFDEKSEGVYWEPEGEPEDHPGYMNEDEVTNFPVSNVITVGPERNRSASHDDYWEVEIDCVTACSKVNKTVDVFMSKLAREKAGRFMRWAKRSEWLAYLIGELKDDEYYIYDIYLPDQRASQTLVDKVVAEQYNQLKIIGVIHSHHEMGAGEADRPSFSGHDAEFINSNHNLSLLAGIQNGGFKIVGIARVKTPCDAFMQVKANVKAMIENPTDEEEALKKEFFKKVFNRDSEDINDSGSYHFTNNPTYGKGGD